MRHSGNRLGRHSKLAAIRRLIPWLGLLLVAALAATYATEAISLSPLRLRPRAVVFAVAKAEVFVDNPATQLVYDGQDPFQEAEYDIYNPKQALELAFYLQSQGSRQQIADAAGIPGQLISAAGPFTLQLQASNTVAAGPQAGQPPRVNPNYRLLVDVDGNHPMLTLYGQAPTEWAARAIVAAARDQLTAYVTAHEQAAPLDGSSKTVVRELGPIRGGVVDPGADRTLFGLVFGLVLLLGGAPLWALRRRGAQRRGAPPGPAHHPPTQPGALEEADDGQDLWPHTRRAMPWLMALFLLVLFFVPVDAILASTGSSPVAPTLDRDLLVLCGLVWLVTLVVRRDSGRPRVRLTRVHAMTVLFLGLCLVSLAVNGHELGVDQELTAGFKKVMVVAGYAAFFLIAASSIRPGEVRPLLKLVVILGVGCAIGTLIERQSRFNVFYHVWDGVLPYTPPPEFDTLDDIGRLGIVGPTSEPLECATLLSLVLPFCAVLAMGARQRRDRILYLLAGAIVMAGAIATGRKTAIVCPVTGVIVLVLYRPKVVLKAVGASLVPMLVVVHLAAPGELGSVLAEFEPSHAVAVNTDRVRVERYDAVRPDVMSHLLFGRGYGTYDPLKYRYLDNQYLGLIIGAGALGTLAFLGVLVSVLTLAHPLIRGPDPTTANLALGLQASLAMIVVALALFDVLSFQHVTYMLFFIAAFALALNKPRRPAQTTPHRPRAVRVVADEREWVAPREPVLL